MQKMNSKLPLVSVLMTAYNREAFIAEAIESVLCSSYKNFELIIVDDGSKDRTYEIAKKYELLDNRIRVYLNEKNLGDYINRNQAASFANGKYLKYVDADDIIYPHGLEVMVNAMEKHPKAVFGTQHNKREDIQPYPILLEPNQTIEEHFSKGGIFTSGPTGVIIRKSIFDLEGGFSGKRFIGDTEFWIKLGSKYPIVKFQPALIWWRTHENQEIHIENFTFDASFARYMLDKKYILSESTPLNLANRNMAFMKLNRRFIINVLKYIISSKKVFLGIKYLIKSKIGLSNIFKSIFH